MALEFFLPFRHYEHVQAWCLGTWRRGIYSNIKPRRVQLYHSRQVDQPALCWPTSQFPKTFPGTESSVFQESPLFWVNGFNTIGHLLLTWNKQTRKCYQQSSCLWLVNDTPVYFQKWGKTRTSWWWTGKPGVLQSMGSQRVGHDWVTELNYWHLWLLSHYFKHFRVTLV